MLNTLDICETSGNVGFVNSLKRHIYEVHDVYIEDMPVDDDALMNSVKNAVLIKISDDVLEKSRLQIEAAIGEYYDVKK